MKPLKPSIQPEQSTAVSLVTSPVSVDLVLNNGLVKDKVPQLRKKSFQTTYKFITIGRTTKMLVRILSVGKIQLSFSITTLRKHVKR